jgi:hypothetical protein
LGRISKKMLFLSPDASLYNALTPKIRRAQSAYVSLLRYEVDDAYV